MAYKLGYICYLLQLLLLTDYIPSLLWKHCSQGYPTVHFVLCRLYRTTFRLLHHFHGHTALVHTVRYSLVLSKKSNKKERRQQYFKIAVSLDFLPFDSALPHYQLQHKLILFDIRGLMVLRLQKSRSQSVLVNSSFSSWVDVTSGIPQGILLVPFLFVLCWEHSRLVSKTWLVV